MKMKKYFIMPLPAVLEKYIYIANEYTNNNIETYIISKDIFNTDIIKENNNKYNIKVIKKNPFIFFIRTCKFILKERPQNIDIYDYTIWTLFFIIFAKVLNIKTTIFIIGFELNFVDKVNKNKGIAKIVKIIKTPLTWLSLFLADNIIIKEYHQYIKVKKYKNIIKKTLFLKNCIPVNTDFSKRKKEIDFLYLNAIVNYRHVDDFVYSLKRLSDENIKFNSNIVGFTMLLNNNNKRNARDLDYEKYILSLLKEHLNYNKNINIYAFTKDTHSFFKKAKYFVLPADIIFVNYALLEAMSFGVVPIVYNGEGVEKIIKHGVNGFICNKGVDNLVETLKNAMKIPEEEYFKLSYNAFNTIKENFNIKKWIADLENFRNNNYKEVH